MRQHPQVGVIIRPGPKRAVVKKKPEFGVQRESFRATKFVHYHLGKPTRSTSFGEPVRSFAHISHMSDVRRNILCRRIQAKMISFATCQHVEGNCPA